MITDDRSKIKVIPRNEFLTVEAVYGMIPHEFRLHMQRVAGYCDILMKNIERDISFINVIEREFYAHAKDVFKYHDIGYAFVPLDYFGEDEEIPEHVIYAEDAFEKIVHKRLDAQIVKRAKECAKYHHENYDGTGYPEGLKGEEIPFVARVCAIADMYDHLVNDNPYSINEGNGEIVDKIVSLSGKKFHPQLVNVFVSCAEKFKRQDIIYGIYKRY
ncbi:MAG: HD domain-containing protein [Lachnospiraceae bacterium]|nr:HD domain-containing protein [Lachnospiraceae bacterium]